MALGQGAWLGGLLLTIGAASTAIRESREPGLAWAALAIAAAASVLAFLL